MNSKILDASFNEIKDGFLRDKKNGKYICLFCDAVFEKGIIYNINGGFVDAYKAVRLHIEKEHVSVFNRLLSEDKKYNGLTETQKNYLLGFYDGMPDKDIAQATNTSLSTVRYQRFNFREKVKQAKIILALAELLEEKYKQNGCEYPEIPEILESATMVDERYMTTDEEAKKIIDNFFISLNPLKLKTFSSKQKNKVVILKIIVKQFDVSKRYSEKQVNAILKSIYSDFDTLRRYLIDYGFMGRLDDGSEYWLKE